MREARDRWSWAHIKQRKLDRNEYITLYKLKKRAQTPLSALEAEKLTALERLLPYDDLIIYRRLANASIAREVKKESEEKAKQGWFSVQSAQ